MSSSSHSRAVDMSDDMFGMQLVAAFQQLHVSDGDVQVQGSTIQSSSGIVMNDTFAVLTSPQASTVDPKFVPVPDSGSENGDGTNWPVQEEPEGEIAPDEVQGDVQDQMAEEEEDDGYDFYRPHHDVQEYDEDGEYNIGDQRQRSSQLQEYGRQKFQRRRLNDGGEWREYRDDSRYSGRREYKEDDPTHDRNKPYQRWTHDEIVEHRRKDEAFAAELEEHHRHPLWRRCSICYARSMKPSWVWNRTCSSCQSHVCCKHAKEMITPVYTHDIVTAEGEAERHVPIGSTHSFYCGEDIRIICSNCIRAEQARQTPAGAERVPYEQRVYFRSIVPPLVPERNGL